MRFASSVSLLVGITLVVACSNDDTGGWETWTTDAMDTGTDTDTSESTSDDDTTDTESDESTTGDVEPFEGLRYIVTAADDALLLGIDLDDPLAVPPAQELITGEGTTGLFGPTPFGSEIVSHDGRIDQLRLNEFGDYDFEALAEREAQWMDRVFFDQAGTNAVMTVGPTPFGAPNELLWLEYDGAGQVTGTGDITPPIEANGSVLVLGRSPDSKWAAVLVDVELDSLWQLYAVKIDPTPNVAVYIDQMDFAGLPPTGVSDFVWLHLDDQRIVYRKEGEPGIFRPLAVDLATAETEVDRINLTPTLGHISSMVWSPDNTRLLVTTGGGNGYRELYLIELEGPAAAQPPLRISEAGQNARVDTQTTVDFATLGHGFDAFNRVWYAYTDTLGSDPTSVGIQLVVVVDGDVISRDDLTAIGPGLEIDEVVFDAKLQRLGYRAQLAGSSAIHHVDLSEPFAGSIRIDQDFEHALAAPDDHAKFAWSADGLRLVVVGKQDGMTTLHVADPSDIAGATLEVTLPDVEGAQGITLDHRPRISPDGEQVILWYAVQDGRTGLVHAPLDGSAEGQVVLGLEHPLRDDAWLLRLAD